MRQRNAAATGSSVLLLAEVALIVEPFRAGAALVVIAIGRRLARRAGRRCGWRIGRWARTIGALVGGPVRRPFRTAHDGVSHMRRGSEPSLKPVITKQFRALLRVSR
ncbi:hypothetical protein WT56_11920 [Burkholderia pseudomultivorans]|uniref:Uncharacterized protein n=1 Tax=Burkholderia pseudomultivorans TaxID=1207504 RepID=A0A132EK09_9BURK|nr:hypothetical protein WT56_11920 [Burkholderia pseudomultivorans]